MTHATISDSVIKEQYYHIILYAQWTKTAKRSVFDSLSVPAPSLSLGSPRSVPGCLHAELSVPQIDPLESMFTVLQEPAAGPQILL